MEIWAIVYSVRVIFLRFHMQYTNFLHDRLWISPWIKSISNELDITCQVFTSQLCGHYDVIASRLWRHQQNVQQSSETLGWCVKILIMEPPTMLLVPICRDMQLWWDKPPIPSPRNRMPGDTCFDDVGRNCACVTWTQMYVTLQTKNVFHSKAVIILLFNPPLC